MKTSVFFILAICLHFASFESTNEYETSDSSECKIKYSYTLWIGDNIDDEYTINLKSPCGIVFLDAMEQAASKNSNFDFTYTTHPLYGAFITSISGVYNVESESKYWMIYVLTAEPDVDNQPGDTDLSDYGVSSLEVLDGGHYLFWLKTVVY